MPYATNADLPKGVRDNLPEHGQDIYRKTFNDAHREYGNDEQAAKVAWAAVKKIYEKNEEGKWVKK